MVNWKHRRGYECFNPECWHVIDATCGECEEVVMKVYDGE